MKCIDFEIKNNEFLRQFEATIGNELVKLEYSEQERKIFLSKFAMSDHLKEDAYDLVFLKKIFDHLKEEGKVKVVPTSKEVKSFFKAHKHKYRDLLPTGITL